MSAFGVIAPSQRHSRAFVSGLTLRSFAVFRSQAKWAKPVAWPPEWSHLVIRIERSGRATQSDIASGVVLFVVAIADGLSFAVHCGCGLVFID
jgi:hypothetical protein